MKKITLLCFIFFSLFVQAQPKLAGTLTYWGPQYGGSIFRVDMPGTTPGVTYSFNNLAPHMPRGGVCAGDNDWLYGMVVFNGVDNSGGLYKIKKDGTGFTMVTNITNFPGATTIPYYHTDGNIYFSDESSIKKLDPSTNTTTDLPLNNWMYTRSLCIDSNDWIYYLTIGNSISKIKTDGTQEANLYTMDFTTEGNSGFAGLTEIPGDSLFGIQTYGGSFDGGTLYSIKKDGTGFTLHHHFTTTTGIYPESKLIYFDGKLYGSTTQGGNFGFGVIFSINADGSNYRVIHHFETGAYYGMPPAGNLAISSNGRIFGAYSQFLTTLPSFQSYLLFKLDTSGANFDNLFVLNQRQMGTGNLDICLLNDDSIFVPTSGMASFDGGALNYCDTSGNGWGLYQFGFSPTGFRPNSLIKASNNKLYGTATIGGSAGSGVIYSVNDDGSSYTKLHEFDENTEGYQPEGKLLEASDGKLYGTCRYGGPTGSGCIYRIDKDGNNFTSLFTFPQFDQGFSPVGSLVEDNSGVLYGATFYGSPSSGVIYKINKDGSNYTVLKTLNGGTTEFASPYNGVALSGNYLYATCGYGGAENKGGVIRIKTDGTGYQVLHEFNGTNDGSLPMGAPIVASNGKVYGTTSSGGNNMTGTVYRVDIDGSNYTILRNLDDAVDGGFPVAGIIQASDGLLYGSTYAGGSGGGGGTLYKLNLDGSGFTVIRSFSVDNDGQGNSTLIDLRGNFVLPVELISFNGEKKGQTSLLTWKTAQEQNNDHFEIERSPDGSVNSFVSVGTIPGKGNTNNITSYSFTDRMPLDGINYYRLKQVDIDGKFTYSRTIPITFAGLDKVIVYPNPASDRLYIRLPRGDHYTTARIMNTSGSIVQQTTIITSVHDINIRALPSGWYTLQLIGEKQQQQVVFLKQ